MSGAVREAEAIVRKATIGVASPSQETLPVEKTWVAVVSSIPTVSLELIGGVTDATDGWSYDESDFPVSIPLGHTIQGSSYFGNLMSFAVTVNWATRFVDPDGLVRGEASGTRTMEAQGEGFDFGYADSEEIILDIEGSWTLYVSISVA